MVTRTCWGDWAMAVVIWTLTTKVSSSTTETSGKFIVVRCAGLREYVKMLSLQLLHRQTSSTLNASETFNLVSLNRKPFGGDVTLQRYSAVGLMWLSVYNYTGDWPERKPDKIYSQSLTIAAPMLYWILHRIDTILQSIKDVGGQINWSQNWTYILHLISFQFSPTVDWKSS